MNTLTKTTGILKEKMLVTAVLVAQLQKIGGFPKGRGRHIVRKHQGLFAKPIMNRRPS